MFFTIEKLQNEIPESNPDPKAANALQEVLGGKFGEMRVMMQYMFQTFNFRGTAKPYQDLLRSIAAEEIGHVELVSYTINMMLEGSTKNDDPNTLPLSPALDAPNIHHFLVAGQSSRPVDAVGNPFQGEYIYNSGHLPLDLIYNLTGEATGTLQMCRLYQMSDNKAFRATLAFLIARDHAHQKAWAKALELMGVKWSDQVFAIPHFDYSKLPDVKAHMENNLHNQQWTFSNGPSQMSKIFSGDSPFGKGQTLETIDGFPEGFSVPQLPEAPQEFSSGMMQNNIQYQDQSNQNIK
jgi:Mn-containing catalase